MKANYWILVAAGVIAGLIISGRFVLHAQDRARSALPQPAPLPLSVAGGLAQGAPVPDPVQPHPALSNGSSRGATLQEALLRPYRFPFARPTSLEQVCAHLKQTLNAPVALDLAALDRKKVGSDDTVVLELDGVRLKTGLKLLLDQVGLTFRVIAEDNLLIITDKEGSEDPGELVLSELRALHRDLHAVQDAVDEIREVLVDDPGDGARVQKPTIIEEMPDNDREKPAAIPQKPASPSQKQDGSGAPAPAPGAKPSPGTKPAPARVPLAAPRRRLSLPVPER
jgi:hypothetical protein